MMKKYKQLYLDAFPYDSEKYFDKIVGELPSEQTFFVQKNGEVVSGCYVRFFDAKYRDCLMQVAVLGGVCTDIYKRGKGHAGVAISNALNYLNELNQPFCFLHPVDFSYYKRYDFLGVLTGQDVTISGGEEFCVQEIDRSSISEIVDFSSKMNDNNNFSILCHTYYVSKCYDEVEACEGKVYKICKDDFIAYTFTSGSSIDYLFTNNFYKILSCEFFRGYKVTCFYSGNIDYIQGRITSIPKALSIIKPRKSFNLKIKFTDKIVKNNNVALRVVSDGEQILTNIVDDDTVDFTLDVKDLISIIVNGSDITEPILFEIYNKY